MIRSFVLLHVQVQKLAVNNRTIRKRDCYLYFLLISSSSFYELDTNA